MISVEMKNMMVRTQISEDMAKIKEELAQLREEIESLRLLLNRSLQ